MSTVSDLLILAAEGGIPPTNPWAQIALPLGIFIFVGSVYMLLRSNLGTRRAYLVMSTSLWGFSFLMSLFWAFGAPGTPPNTGPQNLPGQSVDHYQPTWNGLAGDSFLATEPGSPYAAITQFPDGWGPVPADLESQVSDGASAVVSFFSGLTPDPGEDGPYTDVLLGTEATEEILYAVADNGRPMIAVTVAPTCSLDGQGNLPAFCEGLEINDPVPADAVDDNGNPVGERTTVFGFFNPGAVYFPSLVMAGILLVLFALHMVLLYRDERREKMERDAAVEETVEVEEKATVGV
jgi:hypothetical protein